VLRNATIAPKGTSSEELQMLLQEIEFMDAPLHVVL
jgi:hypothetical protein